MVRTDLLHLYSYIMRTRSSPALVNHSFYILMLVQWFYPPSTYVRCSLIYTHTEYVPVSHCTCTACMLVNEFDAYARKKCISLVLIMLNSLYVQMIEPKFGCAVLARSNPVCCLQTNVFYSGCVICELRDYRRSSIATYSTDYILLKPTQQVRRCLTSIQHSR